LAGKQSSAFWGFVQILKDLSLLRPPLVLLENVPGFLTSHGGKDLQEALLALNRLGYAVDAFMIDASRFVPQSRLRLFIVGRQSHPTCLEEAETPTFFQSDARPPALANFILSNPQIDWSIRRLPALPNSNKRLKDIIEDLPTNSKVWWSRERCDYLLNQMSPRHRATADSMITQGSTTYATVFRRVRNGRSMAELRTDGIAGCLRTPRGGSGRQILVAAGRGQFNVRLLTARECARLMGADDFTITVPLNQALFGFGDAVCVPVVEWIALNYLLPALHEMRSSISLAA
jgi:DNA (cytosine-5)-methyltransferase 1